MEVLKFFDSEEQKVFASKTLLVGLLGGITAGTAVAGEKIATVVFAATSLSMIFVFFLVPWARDNMSFGERDEKEG
jgi:hypothetical protein